MKKRYQLIAAWGSEFKRLFEDGGFTEGMQDASAYFILDTGEEEDGNSVYVSNPYPTMEMAEAGLRDFARLAKIQLNPGRTMTLEFDDEEEKSKRD